MSSYVGTAIYSTSITLPDDGIGRAVATVNPGLQGLADRTIALANQAGPTEYATLGGAAATYTPAAFASWQTYGKLQLLVAASGVDCTLSPPPGAKDGDVWDVVFLSTSTALANGKNVKTAVGIASFAGVPVNTPYFTAGTWRFSYSVGTGFWGLVNSQAVAREGFIARFGGLNSLGALPAALLGSVRTINVASGGVYSFKAGDTIFARLSGMHTRINAAAGVDDSTLSYYLVVRCNGGAVATVSNQFPNEERNRQMFNAYTSQVFPVALEVAYTLSSPLTGVWTVESSWLVNGASQVVNPQRSYVLTTTAEVQRGSDF